MAKQSRDLEAELDLLIRIVQQDLADPPDVVSEHLFHPSRRWRFDRAIPEHFIAFEAEGGSWLQTKTGRSKGHLHPVRFTKDCEKYNAAALLGWKVFRFTGKMFDDGLALSTIESIFTDLLGCSRPIGRKKMRRPLTTIRTGRQPFK